MKHHFMDIGCVSVSEYNWKKDILKMKKQYDRGLNPYLECDIGKILGISQYALDLEEKCKELKLALVESQNYFESVDYDCSYAIEYRCPCGEHNLDCKINKAEEFKTRIKESIK